MYPVLIDFGVYQLRAYGVVLALAILTGVWSAERGARRKGLDPALVGDALWLLVVAALVGARLYYVAFHDPAGFLARPLEILAVWQGRLSVHGALLGGLLAAAWYVRRQRVDFWAFGDVVAPGLILGQTVGQLACLLNGDSHGSPTRLPWAIVFSDPRSLAPLGVALHPVEVYEGLAYLLVFFAVRHVSRRAGAAGTVLLAYAVGYGIARFAVEFFRGNPPVVGGVNVPQAASAVLAAAGLVIWWCRRGLPLGRRLEVRRSVGTLALVVGFTGVVVAPSPPVVAEAAGAADPAPEVGRRAPDFTLPNLAGTLVHLADFQGRQAVLINFWATWCPPCREEMPTLERLARTRRGSLQVLGVSLDTVNPAKVRAFVRELGVTFSILLDRDLAVATLYRVRGLPASFVLDRDGIVRFREIGYRDWTDRESQVILDQALRAP